MIEREEVDDETSAPPNCSSSVVALESESEEFKLNLEELQSLHEYGEKVCWPEGYTALTDKQIFGRSSGM